jgi:hypothetical protein
MRTARPRVGINNKTKVRFCPGLFLKSSFNFALVPTYFYPTPFRFYFNFSATRSKFC